MPRLLVALAALLLTAPSAAAAPGLAELGSFADPVHVTAPPGDGSRVFVVEQAGRVWVVRDGVKARTPFLDISARVVTENYEQGLLSLAFSPDYASSGRLYLMYTGAGNDLFVEEFRRDGAAERAQPAGRLVATWDHSQAQVHNGGQLAFGPDGRLYVASGDGGTQGDPENDARNLDSPLGKVLRFDPTQLDGANLDGRARPYVHLYGVRNPWRFSFDRGTGDLWITDVGGEKEEEVTRLAAGTSGADLQWSCREGAIDGPGPVDCDPGPGSVGPLLSYGHDVGCAVTGGFVVRDPSLAELAGRYVFGDFCAGQTWSTSAAAPARVPTGLRTIAGLSSFGEDSCGHLYVAAREEDKVFRLQTPTTAPCPVPPPPPTPGATTGPGLRPPPVRRPGPRLSGSVARRVDRSGRFALRVGCPRVARGQCFGFVRLFRQHLGSRLASALYAVPPGRARTVRLRLNRPARRALARRRALRVGILLRARDRADGPARTTKVWVTLRPAKAPRSRGPSRRRTRSPRGAG